MPVFQAINNQLMKLLSDVPCRFILNSPLAVVVFFFLQIRI